MKKGVFYDVKIALRVIIIYNAFTEEEVKLKHSVSSWPRVYLLHVQIKVEN